MAGYETEITSQRDMPHDRRAAAYTVVRLLVGAFLWFGAITKGYQVATEPIAESKWFAILSCQYEWWLGILLISGVFARHVRLIALATFTLFSVVSGYLALQGAESCGCFGAVHVNPRITLALDLSAIVALLATRPAIARQRTAKPRIQAAFLATGALAAVIGFWPMWHYESSKLALDGHVLGDAKEVLIEPTDWLGKPCPLLSLPAIDSKLGQGKWIVLLYHSDCPGCCEVLGTWPKSVLHHAPNSKTAIISASPKLSPDTLSVARRAATVVGYLPDTHEWFVPTPTILCLDDGLVTSTIVQGEKLVFGKPQPPIPLKRPQVVTRQEPPASPAPASVASPKAITATGTQHDLGYVEPKSVYRVRFVLKNATDSAWKIRSVRSECNCMRCVDPPKELPAGKSTPITIELKSPEKTQRYAKKIVVFTDSKDTPSVKYHLAARIGLPLRVVPAVIDLEQPSPSEACERTVEVVNDGSKPVKLLYATSNDSSCFARVPLEPIGAGKRVTLPVVFRPVKTSGNRSYEIRLHTNCAEQQLVTVSARVVSGSSKQHQQKS